MKKLKPVIMVAIIVIIAIGIFAYLLQKPSKETAQEGVSEISQLLGKDYEKNYPGTPREVVKDFSDILLYLYNENYETSDLNKLTILVRQLFDDELLEANPLTSHASSMQNDVSKFKASYEKIVNYTPDDIDKVNYFTFNGRDCAGIQVYYFIKTKDGTFSKNYKQFFLRKDSAGKWKIYGYKDIEAPSGN